MAEMKSTDRGVEMTAIVGQLESIHSTITVLRNALRADDVEESQDAAALLDYAVVNQMYEQIEMLKTLTQFDTARS